MDIKECMVQACSTAGAAGGSWSETTTASGKRYVVELQPEFGCFTPTFIAVSFGKTVLFKVVFLMLDHYSEPEAQQSGPDVSTLLGPELRYHTIKKVSKLLAEGVAKDVGKAAVQRQLERALQGRISDRYLRKLTKSLTASAVRKHKRYSSRLLAARGMLKTGFWNSLLGNAAYFIIEEGVTAFVYIYRYFRGPKPGDKDLPVSLRRTTHQPPFLRLTLENLCRGVGTVYCEAFGAAIGTAILPGTGTFVGQFVFSVVPMFF